MAIENYSALVTAADSWLVAGTLSSARLDECIALGEGEMSDDLLTQVLETRAYRDLVADDEYTELPSDLRKLRSVVLLTDPRRRLEYLAPDAAYANYTLTTGEKPSFYTLVGTEIRWVPKPDAAYRAEIIYQIAVPSLSSAAPTNRVLTRYPQLYLAATLMHAHAFLEDDARAQTWRAKYQMHITTINRAETDARWGGTSLAMRQV